MKVSRSPYAETAMAIVEEIQRDPYSNGGGGLEKVQFTTNTTRLLISKETQPQRKFELHQEMVALQKKLKA